MTTAQLNPKLYQQPLWGTLDRVSRNCLIAAAVLGLLVIITVFVAPVAPPRAITIEEMPERFARLILEKPAPAPVAKVPTPGAEPPKQIAKVDEPKPDLVKPTVVKPKARPERRQPTLKVAQDKGQQGRQKAKTEVTRNLKEVSGSLDKVLGQLAQALPAAAAGDQPPTKSKRRPRRGVRGGRTSTQLAAVDNIADLGKADIQGSSLANQGISVASITDLEIDGDGGAGAGSVTGSSTGHGAGSDAIRSNQSLLTVVRRYAPGIQFCYENELKKSPGLRGKLTVSLTVEPDGLVSNVMLVEDSLRSPAVTGCMLAQMRGWRFPAIEAGTVTFKTPFVFTPPE